MSKKPTISFADLGLSTPLPAVLTKSKQQRHQESIQAKKDKKRQAKDAVEEVSQRRDVVEKHKTFVKAETEREKREKAERKRELRVEHTLARNERDAAEEVKKKEFIVAQRELTTHLLKEEKVAERHAKEVRALIEKEQAELAKHAPRSVHINIVRTPEIMEQREGLPVLREEQPIVEAVHEATRSCVLVCGETGSGKTTQIPQFLWEAGYGHPEGAPFGREGRILVTEPRRVAAVSMARRVAEELNVVFGEEVCYHVRYDNNLSDNYKMKFATEGIVLKEIQSDFLLSKYSAVVIDEAHERSISCDILIGLLSRIVPLRNDLFQEQLRASSGDVTHTKVKPLKLIIMSATMRVADFKENRTLFPIVPQLINVEARRFPVSNHFARKTELKEYVSQAFSKVCQIHKKLPPGGILVFLCTQQEIEDLCQQLRTHYSKTRIEYYDDAYNKHALLTGKSAEEVQVASSDDDENKGGKSKKKSDNESSEAPEKDEYGLKTDDYALDDDADVGGARPRQQQRAGRDKKRTKTMNTAAAKERTMQDDADYWGDEEEMDDAGEQDAAAGEEDEINGELDTLHVLPLYALLDFQKQQEVFKRPPRGKRLCVVATNVAETSITIPNIKYVVDAGRVKTKVLDDDTKASCYRIEWTSQASAEQRSGRAGRVGPGHCYRLFSTAVYSNLMPKHSTPELLRTPLDSVVLLMKHIGIEHVASFPFPSPPRELDLKVALEHLAAIGALDSTRGFRITELGKQMIAYPVPPRFARALTEGLLSHCSQRLSDAVAAIVSVAAITTTIFTGEGNQIKSSKQDTSADVRRDQIRALVNPGSDLVTYLNGFSLYLSDPRNVCRSHCLVSKSMYEAKLLYYQLRRLYRQQSQHGQMEGKGDASTATLNASDNGDDDVADSLDVNETWTLSSDTVAPTLGAGFALTREEEATARRLFIPGLVDQVARRASVHECRSLGVEYNDKKTSRTPYLITSSRTIAYIHPTSTVSRTFPAPEYVTFAFLQKVVRSENKETMTMMLGVTVVTKEWLNRTNYAE